jgi:preprotein translocase subunit SecD
VASIKPEAAAKVQEQALKQNITTLHNRINELGVAEPVIQQQGADRIVVQLPGVQDTAKAKDILGRTATLELRMVDESSEGRAAETGHRAGALWLRALPGAQRPPVIVKRQVILTGENLTDAQPGFDSQTQQPKTVEPDAGCQGRRVLRDVTRENIGKRMAIVLFEKGKGEVVTAPVIRRNRRRPGADFRPHDRERSQRHRAAAARRLAGRADGDHRGIHHRPQPGRRQHPARHSTAWSGAWWPLPSSCAPTTCCLACSPPSRWAVNLLLLVAMLSMLQATLTLPGMAAMALALGMAIDSNVLINERIREELRAAPRRRRPSTPVTTAPGRPSWTPTSPR